MIKKILIIIFLPFALYGCDYTPIYSADNSYDFYIEKIIQEGNGEINTLIRNKLKRYQKKESKKSFIIKNISSFKKNSLSKNKSGKTNQFLLSLEVQFIIKSENNEKDFVIKEEFSMKNFENEFDERNYERTIKNNMTELVVNNLIIQLSRMQ